MLRQMRLEFLLTDIDEDGQRLFVAATTGADRSPVSSAALAPSAYALTSQQAANNSA
jgi:hypothetical protein